MPVVADFPDVDQKDYQIIYPQYIDSNLTISEGRRMPKDKCVANPMSMELYQACMKLGLPVIFQPEKGYGRQSTARRGRIKVLVKQPRDKHYIKKSEFDIENRGLIVLGIANKTALMSKFAEIILALPARLKKAEEEAAPILTTGPKKDKKKKGKK